MLDDLDITLSFKHCYPERFELNLVNRTEILTKNSLLNLEKQCYIPFYKMFIDWTGDVLICNNDWGRHGIIGNVNNNTIKDIWLSNSMNHYRKELMIGNRKNCDPCKFCNVNGTVYGKSSFDLWRHHVRPIN